MGGTDVPWAAVLEVAKQSGVVGIAFVLGYLNLRWLDRRDERKEAFLHQVVEQFRHDVQGFMDQYRTHMGEFRDKYDANCALASHTQEIAKRAIRISEELTSIVSLNTQVQTRLSEKIEHNMFCPIASGRMERPR